MGTSPNAPLKKYLLSGVIAGVVLVGIFACAMKATDSRPFCASCHAMQAQAITHKLGSHADLACNDCHAPHNLLSKIPFKAAAGLTDFLGALAGKEASLRASKGTRDQVNTNCKSCHAQTNVNVASMDAKPYCVDCHRNVAHMRSKPIDVRMVAYE